MIDIDRLKSILKQKMPTSTRAQIADGGHPMGMVDARVSDEAAEVAQKRSDKGLMAVGDFVPQLEPSAKDAVGVLRTAVTARWVEPAAALVRARRPGELEYVMCRAVGVVKDSSGAWKLSVKPLSCEIGRWAMLDL